MTTVGEITSVGGMYQMNGTQYDLETLMMTLQMERANNIESQLVDQANQIKERNALLGEAQKWMSYMRGQQSLAGDGATQMSDECLNFCNAHKIAVDKDGNDKKHNESEWSANIENMKGFVDSLNSSSQMDMIRLQGLISKRDQSFEMMTNLMSKFAKTVDAIVGNLR